MICCIKYGDPESPVFKLKNMIHKSAKFGVDLSDPCKKYEITKSEMFNADLESFSREIPCFSRRVPNPHPPYF